jgi:hypothetical protein
LGFAARAVVVLLFFTGFVHVFDLLGKFENAIFDGIDSGVKVDVVIVFIDGPLLAFTSLLARVSDKK